MEWTERHPVLRVLFHGHVWLALGAAAQRWWIGEVGVATEPLGLLSVFFAVIAGYGYLRSVRAAEPDMIASAHIAWVRKNQVALKVSVVLAAMAAIVCAWDQRPIFGMWTLLLVPLLAAYLVPWRDAHGRSRGLREVPGLKALLVALGWIFLTCGFTDQEPSRFDHDMHVWITVMQFCFFLALAIAFDIGDVRYDRAALRTVPQVVGARMAKAIAIFLLVPWVVFYAIMLMITYEPIAPGWREPAAELQFLLPLIGTFAAIFCIMMANPDRPRWFFAVLIDGLILLIPLLAWIGAHL